MTPSKHSDCLVIGAGFGGLAAAIRLGVQGHSVRLIDKDQHLGGKAGVFVDGDFRSDTGPSVLTMLEEAQELLRLGKQPASSYVEFIQASPAFRYLYDDGTILDVHHSLSDTRLSIQTVLGKKALDEFNAFMDYARDIWNGSAPLFVQSPAPHWTDLCLLAIKQWSLIPKMDPLRSMKNGILRFVENPYLIDLLLRYATYNGSDPRQAPATLNCIAHVELALGGYGVVGGIEALVYALGTIAEENNVLIELGCSASHITKLESCYQISTSTGVYTSDTVIVNADASHLKETLLPRPISKSIYIPKPYSMSGWTAIYEVPIDDTQRVGHTVLFPKEYTQEFIDIFDYNQCPTDPTIYICAQRSCHGRKPTENGTEALFVMINTPPESPDIPTNPQVWNDIEKHVRQKLQHRGVLPSNAKLKWMRTPADLAMQYPGSRGAIYGSSSNNRFAAFTRPSNELSSIKGVFLASGSAHPGGGMPMAMISGKHAANACHSYLTQK